MVLNILALILLLATFELSGAKPHGMSFLKIMMYTFICGGVVAAVDCSILEDALRAQRQVLLGAVCVGGGSLALPEVGAISCCWMVTTLSRRHASRR